MNDLAYCWAKAPADLRPAVGIPICTRPRTHVGDHVSANPSYAVPWNVAHAELTLSPINARWENR